MRYCGLLDESVAAHHRAEMLARAQKEGFTALSAIKRDPAFSAVREQPMTARAPVVAVPDGGLDYERTLAVIERSILEQALRKTGGNKNITFMDNCWDYHNGESERRMGLALGDGYRKKVFLMTKFTPR